MKNIRLSDAKLSVEYFISEVKICDEKIQMYLKNLGLICGAKIVVLKTNFLRKTFLVKVMEIKYSLDKKLADEIYVYE